jgi:lipopolysaccharide transport system permease protein
LAQPLALAFVFFFAFGIVMKVPVADYPLILITGLFPWQWFANSVTTAHSVFLENAAIIKKVRFPRYTLVVSRVLQDMVHYILAIPVIFFFMWIYGRPLHTTFLLTAPPLLAVQFFLVLGVSLALASVNLFFRDMERVISIFTMFLFYFTPIVYAEQMVPEKWRYLLVYNPMCSYIIAWRRLFLSGRLEWDLFFQALLFAGISMLLGSLLYRKLSRNFAEVI